EQFDHLRRALMWEPRGHADMYGALLTEPVTPDGDLGVLFLHNEGFSTMCGHGVIALAKVLLDTGMLDRPGDAPEFRMDTPAGRVTATAQRTDGVVTAVSFRNVPSFVYALDQEVEVPGLGRVRYDVAFGGAFYAFVDAAAVGVGLAADDFRRLIDVGMQIKRAVMASLPIEHPFEPDLGFLYGVIFVGPPENPQHHSRNVCMFADGEIDRSPTG
ncbi:MAG: proline racemase family protein, partial [Caldilineaceae bacterium]|nr:proline racemase family protein [Caldilineaceae bacterium]